MIQQDVTQPKEAEYGETANRLFEKMQDAVENSPLKLDAVFDSVMNSNAAFFQNFRVIASALCVLFIVLHVIKTIHEAAVDTQKAKNISPLYLIKMFGLVMCVCFYNQFFAVVEGWLVLLSDSKILENGVSWEIATDAVQSILMLMVRDYVALLAENSTDFSAFGFNLSAIGKSIAAATAPNKWVYAFSALSAIAAYFNYLVSFVAYLDRTVVLLLLTVLAPFAFSLTILDAYRKLAAKYFMMIVAIMLVYPFILISFEIVDQVYMSLNSVYGLRQATDSMLTTDFGAQTIDVAAGLMNYDIFLKFPLLVGCIMLKLKFLSLIGQTLWKILL